MGDRRSWPSPQDFDEAVQTPELSFGDEELRLGTVETNALGLPRPICGSFASVYKLACGNRTYAVRCFLHSVQGQKERYELISKFIRQNPLPSTATFEYQHQGIKVNGKWFPILKMEWVTGETLDRYVSRHFNNRPLIERLLERFVNICQEMQQAGIAHGDLQHGNILVLPDGHIRLVDYDGMYVPEMKGLLSNELGHRNYQHPERAAEHFGPELDNFSAWVVFVSLKAIATDPAIYKVLRGGDDCLLFRRQDFENPDHSKVFDELLKRSRPLPELAETMRMLLKCPPLNRIPFPPPPTGLVRVKNRAADFFLLAGQSIQPQRSDKNSQLMPRSPGQENYPNPKISVKGLVTRKYCIGDSFEIECEYEIRSHTGVELLTPVMQICKELWEKIERGEELALLYDGDRPYIFWWNNFTDKRFAGVIETPLRSLNRRLRLAIPPGLDMRLALCLVSGAVFATFLALAGMGKGLAILSGIVLFGAMSLRYLFPRLIILDWWLTKCGTAVRGRICKVAAGSSPGTDHLIQYEYPVLNGENVIDVLIGSTKVSREQWLALEDGEAVTILYDRNNPNRSMIYRLSFFRALLNNQH